MTSDTSDIRGPIPLTRAGLQVRPVVSLMFVLCNLSPFNAWHTPCPRGQSSPCVRILEDAAGHETHGHEKSNDDRRTLYHGSQRSRTTTMGLVARSNRTAIAPLSWLKLSGKQLDKSSKGENRNEIFPGSPLRADQSRPPKDGGSR